LNRSLFEPFITKVLRTRFQIVDLSSSNDYRLVGEKSLKTVYLYPLSSIDAQKQFEDVFLTLTHREKPIVREEKRRKVLVLIVFDSERRFDSVWVAKSACCSVC
jgi:predicted ATPase